jgi:hypothetical protein
VIPLTLERLKISNDLDATVSLAIGIPQSRGHRPLAIWKTMSGESAILTSENVT